MHALRRFRLDCSKCTPTAKVFKGCEKPVATKNRWKVNGVAYQRCPRAILTRQTWDYLRAHELFERNMLPNCACWIGETQKFLDAMQLIEIETIKIDKINNPG